jgi:hypothetical protein
MVSIVSALSREREREREEKDEKPRRPEKHMPNMGSNVHSRIKQEHQIVVH